MKLKKRILVAPLNWGLGHATRCIPIINALLEFGFEPIIASDGPALELLKKEFSSLKHIELPSYKIKYPKKGNNLKLKLLKDAPKTLKAIKAEKKQTKELVKNLKIDGIISDNRFGVYNKKIPSVFITHQLNVLSGNTTWLSSRINQKLIKKFDECWVPDLESQPNLSGKLGHVNNRSLNIKYIGSMSRFNKLAVTNKYNLMVLLSGPEPQRTLLEDHLLKELLNYKGGVLFVRGLVEPIQTKIIKGNITLVNFMQSKELENAIAESELILSRSGYTTVLDLSKMEKNAFFIPTPGQYEQEYLAKRLDDKKIIPSCKQDEFTIDELKRVNLYYGFTSLSSKTNFEDLFSLF